MSTAGKSQHSVVIGLLLIIAVLAAGCASQQPYKIGFAAGLTGRQSDIGVAGRNGVILAVEEINKAGGIKGRQAELIVKDDKNAPDFIQTVDAELISAGATVIIGHMTSAAAVAALPVADSGQVLIISPTARAEELAGRDDLMITVIPALKVSTTAQADYAVHNLGLKRMAIVYDASNIEFSKKWADTFTARFESLGGRIVNTSEFMVAAGTNFETMARDISSLEPDGILIIAGAVDTAVICQLLRKSGVTAPIFSSSWAMTDDFIQHGGQAAEGIIFNSPFNPSNQSEAYQQFTRKYQERFGNFPNYAATYAYEAAQLVFAGFKKAGKDTPQAVKAAILAEGKYDGLWNNLIINTYGDAERACQMMTVKNGRFVPLN